MCCLAAAPHVFIAYLHMFWKVAYNKDVSSTLWTGSVKYLATKAALIYRLGRPQINLFIAEILQVIGFISWWEIDIIPRMIYAVHMVSL
jgi:hypothetical protein